MNKQQAIDAMTIGERVTHISFTREEWIVDHDRKFVFEDGCQCPYERFWETRTDDAWEWGWSIWIPIPMDADIKTITAAYHNYEMPKICISNKAPGRRRGQRRGNRDWN